MSATLREYLFGKLRTRLWKRYDVAMKTIAEFGQKFEKDEQEGANNAFRHRYRNGIHLVRAVVGDAPAPIVCEAGVIDMAKLADVGGKIVSLPFVVEETYDTVLTPEQEQTVVRQAEHTAVFGNDNAGDWEMFLATDMLEKGHVVVCLPIGLSDGEKAKAWSAVARTASLPGHPVQDDKSLEEYPELTPSIGEFRLSHPSYPDTASLEFIRGVSVVVSVLREIVSDELDDTRRDNLRPVFQRAIRALEPFGDK